ELFQLVDDARRMGGEVFPQVPGTLGQEPVWNDRFLMQSRRFRGVQRKLAEALEHRRPDFARIVRIKEEAKPTGLRGGRAHEGLPPSGGRMICNSATSL